LAAVVVATVKAVEMAAEAAPAIAALTTSAWLSLRAPARPLQARIMPPDLAPDRRR
jgi:hypothetical protein